MYQMSQKQFPVHFTVVSTHIDQFLQYLAQSVLKNVQHKSYWFAHLTYLMMLHYRGKIIYWVRTFQKLFRPVCGRFWNERFYHAEMRV